MGWQDWLVTGVAGVAGAIVLWKTLGSWKDSRPGSKATPACDTCAVVEIQKIGSGGTEEMRK
jgi:hypothetical protein